MKKLFTLFAAVLMAGSMMAQDVMEINLTDRNSMNYGTDVMITYSNAKYKVVLDVLTNFQWAAGQSYGLANVDNEFSFVEEISTSRRYFFTALTFVFGANMEDVEVTGTAVNGSETISIHAVYPAPAELVATPSITEFRSLNDLEGMTITFTGETLTLEDDPYAVFLVDEGITTVFAQCTYSFTNNVLTINSLTEITPLPEEETDIVIFASELFVGYYDLAACTIHYNPNGTHTALENIATDAKSSKTSKLLKDGKLVIMKDGKKYNVAGQQM